MSKTFIHRVENRSSSKYVQLIPCTIPDSAPPPLSYDLVLGPKQSVSYSDLFKEKTSLTIPTADNPTRFNDFHLWLRVGDTVYALYENDKKVRLSKDGKFDYNAPAIPGFAGPGAMILIVNENEQVVADTESSFTGPELTAVSWTTSRFGIYGANPTDGTLVEKDFLLNKWDPVVEHEGPLAKLMGPVASVKWVDGRYSVFAVAGNGLVYEKQWPVVWDQWKEIENPQGVKSILKIAAVCWVTGRYGLYAVGDTKRMYQMWWDGDANKHAWEDLGGQFDGPITAVSYSAGRYAIYGVGLDGHIYEKWWPDGWAEWKLLQSKNNPKFKTLTSISWADRAYVIASVAEDGNLWELKFAHGWSDSWKNLGHPTDVQLAGPVAAVCWIAEQYAYYAADTKGRIYQWYKGQWSRV